MNRSGKPGRAKDLDTFELCARGRLTAVLGPMERLDCGGGPEGLPDFRTQLPCGGLAVMEVTSETDEAQQALDTASDRFFGSLRLDGSAWRWLVAPAAGADLRRIGRRDLLSLMTEMEASDRRSVGNNETWHDPLVQSARGLRIESIYGWPATAGTGTVIPGSGFFGGWEWNGAATSAWLDSFMADPKRHGKVEKLGRADAEERHLALVLDSRTPAGLRIPLGLVDWKMPGALAGLLPTSIPPEPLTGLWLIPMGKSWLGLAWRPGLGWTILESQVNTWEMTANGWPSLGEGSQLTL